MKRKYYNRRIKFPPSTSFRIRNTKKAIRCLLDLIDDYPIDPEIKEKLEEAIKVLTELQRLETPDNIILK
tara:strand:- start:5444 stop:5653 length:210 start_codon:yes stop_codon:yes gene_type:complete